MLSLLAERAKSAAARSMAQDSTRNTGSFTMHPMTETYLHSALLKIDIVLPAFTIGMVFDQYLQQLH